MNTLDFIIVMTPVAVEGAKTTQMNGVGWYLAGALIAFFLLAYLLYSLVKPEKF